MTGVPIANPTVAPDAIERVTSLLERGDLAHGSEVRRFEAEFAGHCGVDHAVATSNGTTALHAALEALGVGAGDTVVTSPFTFVATANAVALAGATPVFADIDLETYAIDPDEVARVLEARDDVAAVLPVHLYGLPASMDRIAAIADEHGVPVLADACQAHGATYRGEPVGSVADVACFSFYPTKNMTTTEGGMVTTDRESVADQIRSFRNHGRPPGGGRDYSYVRVGHNFRMTSPAAAIGRSQLDRLPEWNQRRRDTAAHYDDAFREIPLELPVEPPDRTHVYHQYTVRASDRDDLRSSLATAGVETAVYYPRPLHRLPQFADGVDRPLERADHAAATVLSLPVHPQVTDQDRRTVVAAVHDHYDS